MSEPPISVLLWCWHDSRTNALQVRIVSDDTAEEVPVRDGVFLLRFLSGPHGQFERCLIRHLASNREAYIQGGSKLRDFVKATLLESEAPPPPSDTVSE